MSEDWTTQLVLVVIAPNKHVHCWFKNSAWCATELRSAARVLFGY
jgi:hypothetical protein